LGCARRDVHNIERTHGSGNFTFHLDPAFALQDHVALCGSLQCVQLGRHTGLDPRSGDGAVLVFFSVVEPDDVAPLRRVTNRAIFGF
jgi:hypothetical protein